MAKKSIPPDTRDAQIRRLKDALYLARRTIIDLMPEPLREPLEAAIWCDSKDDAYEWQAWAIERIIALAESRPSEEMYGTAGTPRAYCPLCKRGAQSPYSQGFAMPTGLRRHLEGSHGSRRCEVFSAAVDQCFEETAEKAKPGYRGPNLEWLRPRLPPWKIVPPEPERPSAMVINFPGK